MAKGKKHDEVNENVKDLEETEETMAESKEDTQTSDKTSETKEEKVEEKPAEETENIELKKKNDEIEALNNKLLRLQADYLNYKDRVEKEKLTIFGDAVSAVICDLLPVIDNLERAISADVPDNFKEGVVMVYNQLMGILSKKGLKEIEALHKLFDHNLHYGVAYEESEEFDDGIVIDVLQKGYTVNDKLIRPSMVRICKKS